MTFYLDKNCFGYKNKVFLEKEDNKTVEIGNEIPNENEVMKTDEISQGAAKDVTNQSLEMLECSSLKMSWSDRTLSHDKGKIKAVTTVKFKNIVSIHSTVTALISWKSDQLLWMMISFFD